MTFLGRLAATDAVVLGVTVFLLLMYTYPGTSDATFEKAWRVIYPILIVCCALGLLCIFLKIWGVN